MNDLPGKLITVDGLDCSGKTTIILPAISKWLTEHGIIHECVADMKSNPFGMAVREVFLSDVSRNTEITSLIMLSCSARRELVQTKIRPMLESGINVICDRFTATTYVYGNEAKHLKKLLEIGEDGIHPDYTFMCRLTYEDFLKRRGVRNINVDRFEDVDKEKFESRLLKYHEYFQTLGSKTSVTHLNTSESDQAVLEEIHQSLSHIFKKKHRATA